MTFKILFSATSLLTLSLLAPSCGGKDKDKESDPCALTTCYNNGYCLNGSCQCPDWYEGSDCSQEVRSKFYGSYYGLYKAENAFGTISNLVTIGFDASPAGVQFIRFNGGSIRLQLLSTTGSFIVPVQSASGLQIEAGYGNFSGNQVFCTFGGKDNTGSYQTHTFNGIR